VDELSAAASSVVNWQVDDSGTNMPRPPLVSYPTFGLAATPVNGLERWEQGYMIGAHTDGSWFALADGAPATAIALSTTNTDTRLEGGRRPTFAQGADHIYACAGGQIRRWNRTMATAELCDDSWRSSHVVAIGTRLVANDLDDPLFLKWSEIGEGDWDGWPAENASEPNARPDPVVAVAENMNELWVFGTSTLQTYQVGSDANNPFDRIDTAPFGLAAPYAYVAIDNQFAFLDNRLRVTISDRRTQVPISDAIQKDLRSLTNVTDAWMYRKEQGQQSEIFIRFPTDRRTFVYNLKSEKWREEAYYSAPFQADYPAGAYAYWPRFNRHLVGSSLSTGGLYVSDASATQELSGPVRCERITGWHEHGSKKRKRSVGIQAYVRRGTATTAAAAAGAAGAYELRTQDDDKPWSKWRPASIGGASDYFHVARWYTGGVFYRRRYHWRWTTSESAALAGAADDVQELAS
jgi:hypothetical protein